MEKRIFIISILSIAISEINCYVHLDWTPSNPAFPQSIYEDVLDPELCETQLAYLKNNTLLTMQFLESGLRIPRGILVGNTLDMGNYLQCLGINHNVGDMNIEGKYCSINVPFDQSFKLPELPGIPDRPDWIPEWVDQIPEWIDQIPEWIDQIPEWIDFDPRKLKIDGVTLDYLQKYKSLHTVNALNGNFKNSRDIQLQGGFNLAVCVPKPCTTRNGINGLLFNLTAFGFQYTDNYCRMNNDKPWVPADYIATAIFSILGFITLLSTTYDIWHTHIIKSDPKSINTLKRSFSLYTNCRRLITFTTNPGALECVDGIRALSMMWIIIGHAFPTLPPQVNLLDSFTWSISLESFWITSGPIAVDTFFMIGGMLLVYTSAGKFTGVKLLKSLHLFYLNRILRMFPLLAATVLLQASFFHRISDGPLWQSVSVQTENCRNYWWTTFLYIQNYMNPANQCVPHSWYLAIDIQLYIISPLVLFWVLNGNKKIAWTALISALLIVLTASTTYIFLNDFAGAITSPARPDDRFDYFVYYYFNTLTRASPFFVGMLFGYVLHLLRGKTLELSKVTTFVLWVFIAALTLSIIFIPHPIKDLEWDNQTYDSLVNAFSRPLWAVGIGMIIVACKHGYGGPVNWFLSLQVWKLPSRISYGMYLFHYPIMFITSSSAMQPIYFTIISTVYRFFSELSLSFLMAFGMTVFIDSPFSTLFKLMLDGGPKKSKNTSKPQ